MHLGFVQLISHGNAPDLLSRAHIQRIYVSKVRKHNNDSYFTQYSNYTSVVKNHASVFNGWGFGDCPRYFILLDFYNWTRKYDLQSPSHCLSTYIDDPEMKLLRCKRTTVYEYKHHDDSNDLHNIPNWVRRWGGVDFVVFSQTLEHLWNPYRAVRNLFHVVSRGGYVFTSVPTINRPHMVPVHFLHFQPMGLAMLFVATGFDIIEVGQYGSLPYIYRTLAEDTWPTCASLLDPSTYLLMNDPDHVAQVWILARKPVL